MHWFDAIVEQRIGDAESQGLFRDLPGRGRPLELEDLSQLPAELRASWLLLKSNGFVPPELEARKQWLNLRDLLRACRDDDERDRLAPRVTEARERYERLRYPARR